MGSPTPHRSTHLSLGACPRSVRRGLAVVALASAWLIGVPCGQARAQWGYGGFGWGFGGGQFGNMMAVENINNRSAAAANYAYATRQSLPGSGAVYANNPNAYINNIRSASFGERFDTSTRRTMSGQVVRRAASSTRNTTEAAPNSPATRTPPITPLSNFFSATGTLVWPTEAPIDGSLGDKRKQADASARAVLDEVKAQGFAPVATVANARKSLVDYGTPAIEYMGQHTTPAVVDSFHQFLLSLYDSLGAAGRALPKPDSN